MYSRGEVQQSGYEENLHRPHLLQCSARLSEKKSGQLAPKFSFLVVRTSILVAKIIFKN